jgi:hypothetical protein
MKHLLVRHIALLRLLVLLGMVARLGSGEGGWPAF